jgi:ribonuclease P protein component
VDKRPTDETRQSNRQVLPKAEILRGQKIYQRLVAEGTVLRSGSIQCSYLLYTGNIIRVGFTVPRKRVRRAVDRNRIKRLMRESYRHSKSILIDPPMQYQTAADVLFVYKGKSDQPLRILRLDPVRKDMRRCLEMLRERIEEKYTP